MRSRGRPKTADVLTPREWEVLALIREGLSNREIADRLGITLAGAKFHVSEIISKLGVTTREEAAAWRPGIRGWSRLALAPPVFLRRTMPRLPPPPKLLLRVLPLSATVGLAVLAWQLIWGGGQSGPVRPDLLSDQPTELQTGHPVTLIGEVVEQRGAVFILEAGPNPIDPKAPYGRPRFLVDEATLVLGAAGDIPLAGGLSAVKRGDLVVVTGVSEPGGWVRAKSVSVNSFFNRHGMITDIGADFLEVRLQTRSSSFALETMPTRFRIDPRAQMFRIHLRIGDAYSDLGGSINTLTKPFTPEPLALDTLQPGMGVSLMGTIAPDGTSVVRYISIFAP